MRKLHTWQQTALTEFISKKKGIVQAATASGKSFFGVMCILESKARIAHIVVPRVGLIDQWSEEFRQAGYHKPIGKFGGKHGAASEWKDINIWTIDTARKFLNNPEYGGDGTMLVVDECHRSTSSTRRRVYLMKPEWCLGLSATAFAGGTYLVNLVGGGLIYNYNFEEGLKDGVVNDYEIHHLNFQLTDDTRDAYDGLCADIKICRRMIKSSYDNCPDRISAWPSWINEMAASTGDPLFRRMQMLWLDRKRCLWSDRNRVLMTCDLVLQHFGERIVIFHQQIEQCNEIALALRDLGYHCAVEHSGLPMKERRKTIDDFRKGEVDILITCRTLDEGFNVPNVSVGIIAASSSTATQMVQRVGRVIRKAARKGKSMIYRFSAKGTVDDFATHNLISSGSVAPERVHMYDWQTVHEDATVEPDAPQFPPLFYATVGLDTVGKFHVVKPNERINLDIEMNAEYNQFFHDMGLFSGRFRVLSDGSLLMDSRGNWVNVGLSPITPEMLEGLVDWLVYTPQNDEEE